MNFTALDFETADETRCSPCEIGYTVVKDGKIVESVSHLIKPKCYPDFHWFNTALHGIRPEDVANSPEFPEVWEEVSKVFEGNFLIAHNASFDFDVLKKTSELYECKIPEIDFSCTYVLSKKIWPELGFYRLEYLSKHFGFTGNNHHRAKADSLRAALLGLKILEEKQKNSFSELLDDVGVTSGKISTSLFTRSLSKRIYKSREDKYGANDVESDPKDHNPDSIFYGKEVVFTGILSSMDRRDAKALINKIGGHTSDTLRTTTNYLVSGLGDIQTITPDKMTGKFKKAISFAAKGFDIEIIDEQTFLENI